MSSYLYYISELVHVIISTSPVNLENTIPDQTGSILEHSIVTIVSQRKCQSDATTVIASIELDEPSVKAAWLIDSVSDILILFSSVKRRSINLSASKVANFVLDHQPGDVAEQGVHCKLRMAR